MRLLRYALIAVLTIVLAGTAAAAWFLQDANRFKPRLEALIAEHAGVPVEIGGDLSWRLWPPVAVAAADVRASHEDQVWHVGRLTADLDAWDLLAAPGDWQVQSVRVADVSLRRQGSLLEVSEARLADMAPRRPAPFTAALRYVPVEGAEPIPVHLDGQLTVDPDTLALGFDGTRIETDAAAGVCDLDARPLAASEPAPPASPHDVLPVAALRGLAWQGRCELDWIRLDGQRIEDVTLTSVNDAGDTAVAIEAPRLFGGEGRADIAIDATTAPLRWTLTTRLRGVDSAALLAALDQRLHWAAPLAYGGTVRMTGNTPEALVASMAGETRFDGGRGEIDISKIRSQLITLAERFNEAERIRGWPEVWSYQRFVGDWRIDGRRHLLDVALDNLTMTGAGDYRPFDDQLDMLFELTFTRNPELPVFDVPPLLYDLPIPVRCRGALADPSCRLDGDAAQRIVAQALASGEDSELKRTLERKIEEDVPEQYRDAARSLLEALGNSLQRRPEQP